MAYRQWEGKRMFSFGYDVRQILVGKQTRKAIRKQAIKLMDQLIEDRKADITVREYTDRCKKPFCNDDLETANCLPCT